MPAGSPTKASGPQLSLAGHQGHLTSQQQEALEEFRRLVTDNGLYTLANTETGKAASHTDSTLLRFLRARSFLPIKALKQFADREEWAKGLDLDNLYASFNIDEFANSQNCYPMWIGRRDKMGYPIHVFRLASLTNERMQTMTSVPIERRYQRITVLHELLIRAVAPMASTLPSESYPTPIDGTTTIVDLQGVSFYHMWGLRGHLQQASVLANANFPETMGMTWIINTPSFFSTIWGWLKMWFDENTRRKIHVLSKSQQAELLTEIDPEDLPKMYGGKLNWTFDEPPNLDAPAKEALKSIGGIYPRGPWSYIDDLPVIGQDIVPVMKGDISAADVLKKRVETDNIPRFPSYPS